MNYFTDERLNDLAMRLRAFAVEEAEKRDVDFWKVLRNKAIVSICKALPRSVDELRPRNVLIGNVAIENYGEAIVGIVNEWCDEVGEIPAEREVKKPEKKTVEKPEPVYEENVLIIKQGGFFYNVSGNDALILNKHFGYKLYGDDTVKTGFPVSGSETVFAKIDLLSINYDVYNSSGTRVRSQRYDSNKYEVVDENFVLKATRAEFEEKAEAQAEGSEPEREELCEPIYSNKAFRKNVGAYVIALRALSNGVDAATGEVVSGMSDDTKLMLWDLAAHLDVRYKAGRPRSPQPSRQGEGWTYEEDLKLLNEYEDGKSIEELSYEHRRSKNAIRSRLKKMKFS